ncbi:MAG: hypothetical protein AB7P02_00480 [Alphaproteobacteria bacterium]
MAADMEFPDFGVAREQAEFLRDLWATARSTALTYEPTGGAIGGFTASVVAAVREFRGLRSPSLAKAARRLKRSAMLASGISADLQWLTVDHNIRRATIPRMHYELENVPESESKGDDDELEDPLEVLAHDPLVTWLLPMTMHLAEYEAWARSAARRLASAVPERGRPRGGDPRLIAAIMYLDEAWHAATGSEPFNLAGEPAKVNRVFIRTALALPPAFEDKSFAERLREARREIRAGEDADDLDVQPE